MNLPEFFCSEGSPDMSKRSCEAAKSAEGAFCEWAQLNGTLAKPGSFFVPVLIYCLKR